MNLIALFGIKVFMIKSLIQILWCSLIFVNGKKLQKVVLKLEFHHEKSKQKAMQKVSNLSAQDPEKEEEKPKKEEAKKPEEKKKYLRRRP
ncbi:hypothetical protein RJ640_028464 [Escallonia rubra]|uniref:Uncharacterized protein n=1 Tax=Escallonia rubra TaxID=112253 RepID=A0AA88UT84_9ASTE|nr:hypothetical protein RJ640_028464 [Escallonia rubra]